MWPFEHTTKYEVVTVDVTDININKKLTLFSETIKQSPFCKLPIDVTLGELPSFVPKDEVDTIELDIKCSLIEKLTNVVFWEVTFSFSTDKYEDNWTCFVVSDKVSYFACEKEITQFLEDKKQLQVYIKGKLYDPLYLSTIAQILIAEDGDSSNKDSVILSDN